MKVSRIILIIILFIAFFEIGIFSSYTIVTSEVPDIQELIDMQVNTITSIFSPENVGSVLIKDPNELNVTNKYELADALSEKAQVDGVNLDNFTVTTADDINEGNFTVEITAYGYASPKSSSTTIVISGEPNYKIIAKAKAVNGVNGIMVDLDSIEIESILKLQNTDDSNSFPVIQAISPIVTAHLQAVPAVQVALEVLAVPAVPVVEVQAVQVILHIQVIPLQAVLVVPVVLEVLVEVPAAD